jgi:hypothetical protein
MLKLYERANALINLANNTNAMLENGNKRIKEQRQKCIVLIKQCRNIENRHKLTFLFRKDYNKITNQINKELDIVQSLFERNEKEIVCVNEYLDKADRLLTEAKG